LHLTQVQVSAISNQKSHVPDLGGAILNDRLSHPRQRL
jgi:hypothetical protein